MLTPIQITHSTPGKWIAPEYSSVCPWSNDNSKLLLVAVDHFQLYADDVVFLKDLAIGASERPRWSRVPGTLTFLRENRINTYDIAQSIILEREFEEYTSIDDGGEADVSEDGDHRVLCGTGPDGSQEIFVYQISTGIKGPVLQSDRKWNNLLLTADNHVLLDGMYLLSERMVLLRKVFGADSHKAVTRYQGREVLITSNSNENPVTLSTFRNGVVMVDLETGKQTGLLALPWSLAVHISAPRDAGFCIVTTYDPLNPAVRYEFHNAIIKVPLDGSAPEVLCYHNSDSSTYTGQPKATVSRDGSRVVYGSNGGMADGPVDTWLLLLDSPLPPPALMPPTPPPVIIPQPPPPRRKRGFWAWLFGWFR